MKKSTIILLLLLSLATMGEAQTVYQKDRWGAALYYLDGNTLRIKDRWGTAVY